MTIIVTRLGSGSAITQTQNDGNLDSLSGINEAQAGVYTVVAADQNRTIECTNAGTTVITLTLISTIMSSLDTSDFKVTIKNIGAGALTLTPTTDTFDDGSATKTIEQYGSITIQSDSTQALWNIISHISPKTIISDVNLITGTYTSAEIIIGGEVSVTDAIDCSALGTDDFDFGATIVGSGSGGLLHNQHLSANFMNPLGGTSSAGVHESSVLAFDFLVLPSAGMVSTVINNGSASWAVTATIYWWARSRL